jgi:hypothetical protein
VIAVKVNAFAVEAGTAVKTVDEVAYGFIRVANEAMCRPIRNLTTMRGYDITTHALGCFGGAGPQHCCAMAKVMTTGVMWLEKRRDERTVFYYGHSHFYFLDYLPMLLLVLTPHVNVKESDGISSVSSSLQYHTKRPPAPLP